MTALNLTGYHLTYDAEMTSASDMQFLHNTFNNGDRTIPSNGEEEYYANYDPNSPTNPFSFQNGALVITASPTPQGGQAYTSGMVTTGYLQPQNQGYFEIRAELPSGAGFWPAFWMLASGPTDYSSEVDIFEQPNNDGIQNYFDSIKTPTYNQGSFQSTGIDLSAAYHTYGMLWTATTMQFYFDGNPIGPAVATPPALATEKMYMIANLAVGGSWAGPPAAGASAQLKIDYMRSYSNDPSVGSWGLGTISSPDGVDTTPNLTGTTTTTTTTGTTTTGTTTTGTTTTGTTTTGTTTTGTTTTGSGTTGSGTTGSGTTGSGTTGSGTTGSGTTGTTATSPALALKTIVLGSGPDMLALQVSEDAYQGDAQFTISVDGKQIGGTQTVTALKSTGSTQAFDVLGSFGAGTHTATVTFTNDAYAGAGADRNLYVTQASINNTTASISPTSLTELSGGAQNISFKGTSGTDTLVVGVSEDAYKGDAQYNIVVDGYIVGSGTYTATASHAAGQVNLQTVTGSWGAGAHQVGVTFLNDAYQGAGADRNLYINSVNYDGAVVTTGTTAQYSNGTSNFSVPAAATPSVLTLHMAEDAYQGDAQFIVTVDGTQLAGAQSVSALQSKGGSQAFSFADVLAAGTHDVGVTFTNDAYGGSSTADRNLYVGGADLNGTALNASAWTAFLGSNGTSHFSLVVPS